MGRAAISHGKLNEKLKTVTFENELYDIQNITLSTDLRIGTELYSIRVLK